MSQATGSEGAAPRTTAHRTAASATGSTGSTGSTGTTNTSSTTSSLERGVGRIPIMDVQPV
ncbi:MAG: hypothetical protein ACTH2X_04295, partial [Brachybacterium tyrofermentans]